MPKRKAEELAAVPESEEEPGSSEAEEEEEEEEDSEGSSCPEVSSDEEESEDDEDGDAFDEVNVNFRFFDPKEIDFHGLKSLLVNYLDGEEYNSSDLVETIIKQNTVGTVVKTSDDENDDPIGVMTVLSTSRYKDSPSMKAIEKFALTSCKDAKWVDELHSAWQSDKTGLIINERFLNCPPQISPPLFQALREEIAWATEDEPTDELRTSFKFKQFILLASVFIDSSVPSSSEGASISAPGNEALVYVRPEDQYLHQYCKYHHMFACQNRAIRADGMQPHRLVMLVDAAKMERAQADLDEVVGNAANAAGPSS